MVHYPLSMEGLLSRSGSDRYSIADGDLGQDDLQDAYLSELLSYSLERLNKEPELLRSDAERVRRQMQEVAVGHYRAFITAAEAVQSVHSELGTVDHHLESLVIEIPTLSSGCNRFMEEAQQTVEKRRLNRTMLDNHPTLMDLLEIPQLMDTCVRNQNYDEALDLEACVSKLATMHAKLPVIQALAEEVRLSTQSMLTQLLQRLRSNIQLPECMRVIGYLRRLAVFSEHEMQLQFLRCREAWLVDIIGDLERNSPYEHLKRVTDLHRMHLWDVVTQFRAIFADDTSGQEEQPEGGLIYSWATYRIRTYLAVVADELPKIAEGRSLAEVLDHCMYCGERLGRVGLDFRGLLPPLFESSVRNLFSRNVSLAVMNFKHSLDVHRWVPLPPMGSSGRLRGRDEAADDLAPPYGLMEHPPLASFVNGILSALNELRHCAPVALRQELSKDVQHALGAVAEAMAQYHEKRIVRDTETALFLAMCRAFVEVVCGYTALCFGRCYGGGPNLVDTRLAVEPVRRLMAAAAPAPAPEELINGPGPGEGEDDEEEEVPSTAPGSGPGVAVHGGVAAAAPAADLPAVAGGGAPGGHDVAPGGATVLSEGGSASTSSAEASGAAENGHTARERSPPGREGGEGVSPESKAVGRGHSAENVEMPVGLKNGPTAGEGVRSKTPNAMNLRKPLSSVVGS